MTTHYTASNRTDAWRLVNKFFPTDYEHDVRATERAGYPIYRSTAEDNSSWISDMDARIELSIMHGKELETIMVWIKDEPEQEEKQDIGISKDDIIKYVEAKLDRYNRLPNSLPERYVETLANELMAIRDMAEALTGESIVF